MAMYIWISTKSIGGAEYLFAVSISSQLASSIYFMNPSVIYMGIVPMMEAPFMMFFMLSVYYVQKWYYIYKAGEGNLESIQNSFEMWLGSFRSISDPI
jgi:hypothetical protein